MCELSDVVLGDGVLLLSQIYLFVIFITIVIPSWICGKLKNSGH